MKRINTLCETDNNALSQWPTFVEQISSLHDSTDIAQLSQGADYCATFQLHRVQSLSKQRERELFARSFVTLHVRQEANKVPQTSCTRSRVSLSAIRTLCLSCQCRRQALALRTFQCEHYCPWTRRAFHFVYTSSILILLQCRINTAAITTNTATELIII